MTQRTCGPGHASDMRSTGNPDLDAVLQVREAEERERASAGERASVPPQDDDFPIGQALRLLRERENVTQVEVARRGGPDSGSISAYETGRKVPSLTTLIQYLNALGLDLHDLQAAFDRITRRPDKLTSRFTEIERRLDVLERRSLRPIHTELKHANRRP